MKTILTHSGMFHADDVFAVGTMLILFPDAQIVRTRNMDQIRAADIVIDVGMEYDPEKRRFDHHQEGGAGMRQNGIPYASFGLIWKEVGERLAGSEGKQMIEERLVMPIDAHDNAVSVMRPVFEGIRQYSIADYLYSFIDPKENSEEYFDRVFFHVADIAKNILIREINHARDRVEGMKEVRGIYESSENKKIILLEENLPWEQVLSPIAEAFFVVYPRKEGTWAAKAVPVSPSSFERKKYFPEAWAGKIDKTLTELTGVPGSIFCHRGRFIAVADSKEGAFELAEKALNS